MKFSSQHIKHLAIGFLLIFAFAHSAKSLHSCFSDCSHEMELASNILDAGQENMLSKVTDFKINLDCAICDFTFQQADLAVSFQFDFAVVEFGNSYPTFPSIIRTAQKVANQSLRGPPNSIG